MEHGALMGLTAVVGLGIAAQWLAWRLKLPAILLLLLAGFAAGPISGMFLEHPWLSPNELMGELLFPVVSLSVAVILFEGGLTLKLAEFKEVGTSVRNLVSIGVVVTWVVVAAAGHYILGFDWGISLLLGAILTVTGPTVIGPLLRQVRPLGSTGTVLKWEGILIDPVGAVLAVLVFEALRSAAGFQGDIDQEAKHLAVEAARSILFTILDGTLMGAAAAGLLVLLMNRYWVPDFLQSAVTLMVVGVAFTLSNMLQEESGLLAVTIMGVVMANQKFTPVKHIIEFKENLRVLLISVLFILLSARLELDVIKQIGWAHLAFLVVVIFVARPASVFASTVGSKLTWKQRLLIALIAPRGIVAAAIASVFAIRLSAEGVDGADGLVPAVFLVIVGTITFCGLCATPIARMLGQAATDPQGVLFVGAQTWAREIAMALKREGFDTLLVDTNRDNTRAARMQGLPTKTGSVLSEHVEHELDLSRISKMIAMTANDEANALACMQMIEAFGRKEVYQLAPHARDERMVRDQIQDDAHPLTGRFLVGRSLSYADMCKRFEKGAEVKATKLTEEFEYDDYQALHGERAVPLFLVTNAGKLRVFTANDPPKPTPGNTVIGIIEPAVGDEAPTPPTGNRDTPAEGKLPG